MLQTIQSDVMTSICHSLHAGDGEQTEASLTITPSNTIILMMIPFKHAAVPVSHLQLQLNLHLGLVDPSHQCKPYNTTLNPDRYRPML